MASNSSGFEGSILQIRELDPVKSVQTLCQAIPLEQGLLGPAAEEILQIAVLYRYYRASESTHTNFTQRLSRLTILTIKSFDP